MPDDAVAAYERLTKKIARLYLSSELPDEGPVEPEEVLDALITEARALTGEHPDDI
jgi:hypothetical protein